MDALDTALKRVCDLRDETGFLEDIDESDTELIRDLANVVNRFCDDLTATLVAHGKLHATYAV